MQKISDTALSECSSGTPILQVEVTKNLKVKIFNPHLKSPISINVATLSFNDSLEPWPEGSAHLLDVIHGHAGPDLVDLGLQGCDVWVAH